MIIALFTVILISAKLSSGSFHDYGTVVNDDPGEALILTPLLEENKIEEAQAAAQINTTKFGGVSGYSGYFTVDKVYNSNLFFWFFPAFEDYENAPVLVWLQGGPGNTSLFGLFVEHGPFVFVSGTQLDYNPNTWVRNHSMLYIDNPAGVGYSFTSGGYAVNQTKIAEGLYSALQQFFTLFPNLRQNDFYLTGESYAGKYVPSIGYKILKENEVAEPEQRINLQGLAIGNGLSDPVHQFIYSDRLYQLGLIDSNTRDEIKPYEETFIESIQNEDWLNATDILTNTIRQLYRKSTGFEDDYNILYENDVYNKWFDGHSSIFNNINFRRDIHVGNQTFGDTTAAIMLALDIPKGVTPYVSELLSNYPILIYNGQLDIIVPYPQTVEYFQNLNFSSAEEYKVAPRHKWYVDDDLAGYVKVAGNLTEVLVRNAGHMAPTDQPVWCLDLIYKFTRKQTIYNDE